MALNPYSGILAGLQTGLQARGLQRAGERQDFEMEQARLAQEAQAAQQKKQQEIVDRILAPGGRTPENIFEASILLPEKMRSGMLAGWEAMGKDRQQSELSFASQVISGLNSDRSDVSAALLEDRAAGAENSGKPQEAKAYNDLAKLVRADPDAAFLTLSTQLAGLPGGKEAISSMLSIREEQRKSSLQPSQIAKLARDNDLTEAQTAKAVADAKKSEAELRKTNEEAGKVALEAEKIKMELAKKSATYADLGEPAKKLVNDAVTSAVNSENLATQYAKLADDIGKEISKGGMTARGSEAIKRAFGTQDKPTALRNEYKRLRNSAVLEMLPPGVASDKDIEIAMGAFPADTDNPELIASFLRGMTKLQRYDAALNRNKSEWVQRVGSLGDAQRDIVISGETVPAGTSFIDYAAKFVAEDGNEVGFSETTTEAEGGGVQTITTQEAYDALPSGAEYIHPDGTRRRKK